MEDEAIIERHSKTLTNKLYSAKKLHQNSDLQLPQLTDRFPETSIRRLTSHSANNLQT